jgi:hypothetical protein
MSEKKHKTASVSVDFKRVCQYLVSAGGEHSELVSFNPEDTEAEITCPGGARVLVQAELGLDVGIGSITDAVVVCQGCNLRNGFVRDTKGTVREIMETDHS